MDDAHVLFAKALRTLSDAEQAVVLKALLPPPSTTPAGILNQVSVILKSAEALDQEEVVREGLGSQIGFLVRLPSHTHKRLKAWSEANEHSMNAIVTGLVQRFLDTQPSGARAG